MSPRSASTSPSSPPPTAHYKGAKAYVRFDIDPIEFRAVRVKGGDSTVTYNGEKHDFEFEFDISGDGTDWVTLDRGEDYTVKYVYQTTDTTDESTTDVVDAGSYRAVIEGIGAYDGTVELSQRIKVEKLDLSEVTVEGVISDSASNPYDPSAIWIDGQRFAADSNIMKEIRAVITAGPSKTWSDNGEYTYTLQAETADDPNIVANKTQDFKSYKVGKLIGADQAFYDGVAWAGEYSTYLDEPSGLWSTSKVTAVTGYPQQTLTSTDGIQKYVVVGTDGIVYQDASGEKHAGWGSTIGTYGLTYRTDPQWMKDNGYEFGGQWSTTLHVYQDKLDADASVQVAFNVDGGTDLEIVTSINAVYDGDDFIQRIAVGARTPSGDDLKKEDGDFDVAYYNADGAKVSKIVDAGTYTLKVTSSKYELSGTTEMTITISPKSLGAIDYKKTALEFDETDNHNYYVPWKKGGVTIDDLGLKYDTGVEDSDNDDKADDGEGWDSLPMTAFKVTITDESGKSVKKMEDEGVYTVSFEARNADAENNYVTPEPITVTVIKNGTNGADVDHTLFSDVTWRDYFADAVAYVSHDDRGWMNGYKGRKVFGSLDSLSRGQVASVLYNMAGGDSLKVEGSYSDLWGYETGFSDVDGNAYYARAIAWAKQAGVVNGYADGTFHPDQAVSRQEFACMLANYAKKYGTYKAASADALDEMSDADQVAEFATESVAWAVENGIIGNSGYVAAGSTIIRADAACMVYNYAK